MLLQQGSKNRATLKPIILDEILEGHKEKVLKLIKKEALGPMEHTKLYEKYEFLVSKQVGQPLTSWILIAYINCHMTSLTLSVPSLDWAGLDIKDFFYLSQGQPQYELYLSHKNFTCPRATTISFLLVPKIFHLSPFW